MKIDGRFSIRNEEATQNDDRVKNMLEKYLTAYIILHPSNILPALDPPVFRTEIAQPVPTPDFMTVEIELV